MEDFDIKLTKTFAKTVIFAPRLWPDSILMGFKGLSVIFGLIIIHESLTSVGPGPKIMYFDKLMHAFAYASLTAALRLGWPVIWGGFIILCAGALGAGLEIAQAIFVQGRTGSLADGAANLFGVFLALIVLYPFRIRR